jgi:hypothetical protein
MMALLRWKVDNVHMASWEVVLQSTTAGALLGVLTLSTLGKIKDRLEPRRSDPLKGPGWDGIVTQDEVARQRPELADAIELDRMTKLRERTDELVGRR